VTGARGSARVIGQLDFRVLGPLEIAGADATPLARGKVRATLAVLLIHANEVVTTDQLIEQVWGEQRPAAATKSVHVYISQLRRCIGPDAILTRPSGYELRVQPGQLDVHRFEQLRQEAGQADAATASAKLHEALGLWRGQAYADFIYEAFAQTTIARLEDLRLGALEERIEADLSLGRHAELVPELATLAREHPLRERIRGAHMLALYRSGRQAEALAAYQDARRALVDGLGIEPGRSLHELERRILVQDPTLELVPEAGDAEPAASVAPGERPARAERSRPTGPLLGREPELAELRASVADAIAGDGRLILVSGEPGIGKSRLLDELATQAAARGVRVLWGRCWEAGGAPAYWPWCQSIRAYVRSCKPDELATELRNGAPDVAELVPEIRDLLPDVPLPSHSDDPDTARFRLLEATAAFLRRASERTPLALILDDLHAADAPSLILLQFLTRELAETRILVVGAYRDTELRRTSPLTLALAELRRESVTRVLPLSRLDRAEIADFIRLTTGMEPGEALVATMHSQTDGNPLFLSEVVRLLTQEGGLSAAGDLAAQRPTIPQGVREAIGRRLGHLSQECNELLIVASVLGREFRVDALQRVSGCASRDVLELLDQAIAPGLIVEVSGAPGRLSFSHALVRDTLQDELSPGRRLALHGRISETLEQLYADDPEPHLAELAHHCFESLPLGDPGRAVAYARRAGERAAHLLAYEEAARLYRMAGAALDMTLDADTESRCEILLALGDAEARAGDMSEAKTAFLQAAEIARRTGLPEALARAAVGYGGRTVWARAGHDPRLIALLRDALDALPPDDSAIRVRLLARLAGALRDEFSREPRAQLSAEAVEMARRLDDPATLAYALDGRFAAILGPDTAAERLAIATETLELARATEDGERIVQGHQTRLIALLDLGDLDALATEQAAMMRVAEELRQPAQRSYVASTSAGLALFRGELDEAEQLIARAQEFGRHALSRDAALSSQLQLFQLRREQGRLEEIEEGVLQAIREYPTRLVLRCALVIAYCDLGRENDARAAFNLLASNEFHDIPFDNEWLLCMCLLADASEWLGDSKRAQTVYDLLLPYDGQNAANADEISLGDTSRSLGNAAHAMARWEEGERHFQRALAANARMGARPWLARTRQDYARMLRARGEHGDSRRAEILEG
jgi:DNA-binding SARP family transcriptional activator/tetratricopeptide (TPR) repeat protein